MTTLRQAHVRGDLLAAISQIVGALEIGFVRSDSHCLIGGQRVANEDYH
jgi:hypothetical protein